MQDRDEGGNGGTPAALARSERAFQTPHHAGFRNVPRPANHILRGIWALEALNRAHMQCPSEVPLFKGCLVRLVFHSKVLGLIVYSNSRTDSEANLPRTCDDDRSTRWGCGLHGEALSTKYCHITNEHPHACFRRRETGTFKVVYKNYTFRALNDIQNIQNNLVPQTPKLSTLFYI